MIRNQSLSFCPYYLKNVILFLDEPSGIAESYVFNPVLCLYHEIQISYNIFGFKSKILIIFLDFNRNFFIFAPKMS